VVVEVSGISAHRLSPQLNTAGRERTVGLDQLVGTELGTILPN
jgi:hypothetical protein